MPSQSVCHIFVMLKVKGTASGVALLALCENICVCWHMHVQLCGRMFLFASNSHFQGFEACCFSLIF